MRLWFLVPAAFAATVAIPALSAPAVVTDFQPVHSLVAQVMRGIGTPSYILPPGASPHHYSMRPSEARRLARADAIFWIGEELTPWLGKAIDSLAKDDAQIAALMDSPGVSILEYGDHDDQDDHADHEEEDDHATHDDHADHEEEDDHADHEEEDDHADHEEEGDHTAHDDHADHEEDDDHATHDDHADHEEEDDHAHVHEGADPHIWLDPRNGAAMLTHIATVLAQADPDNAAAYAANARSGRERIEELIRTTNEILAPVHDKPFVTAHDAYGYFDQRFEIFNAGAIASGDAESPSPARIARIRDVIRSKGVMCVFLEPQLDDKLVYTAVEGTDARVATLDPNGGGLKPGPDLYPGLITAMARSMADCLTAE